MSGEREEVLSVAEGRSRAEIRVRAAQAFDHCREMFRRYPDIISTEKRAGAYFRAMSWEEILEFLDWAELDVFREEDMLSTGWDKEPLWRRIWNAVSLMPVMRGAADGVRIVFAPGKMRLQFYKEAEE